MRISNWWIKRRQQAWMYKREEKGNKLRLEKLLFDSFHRIEGLQEQMRMKTVWSWNWHMAVLKAIYRWYRDRDGEKTSAGAGRCRLSESGTSWIQIFHLSGISGCGETGTCGGLLLCNKYIWTSVWRDNRTVGRFRGKDLVHNERKGLWQQRPMVRRYGGYVCASVSRDTVLRKKSKSSILNR